MDNGERPVRHAAWMPDSGNTTVIRGCFPPMDNGEHLPTQGGLESSPIILLTIAWRGEWVMENGGRAPPAASRARDPGGMTN